MSQQLNLLRVQACLLVDFLQVNHGMIISRTNEEKSMKAAEAHVNVVIAYKDVVAEEVY